MNLNFSEVLATLGADAVFQLVNETRPPVEYLFATLLPERTSYNYAIKNGTMSVRTTMAGLAALDSPYPPGGVIETSTFLAEAAKIANEVMMPEYTLRELQQMVITLMANGQPTNDVLVNEALNFLQKVIVQAHLDTFEWLRGQALVNGKIDWTFGKLKCVVDYGVPAANFLTKRTATDQWNSTTSKFWEDIRLLRQKLRYNVRAFIAHPDTIDAIVNNDVNKCEILRQEGFQFTIRRLIGTLERPATDARDTITLIPYQAEAEVLDPANPGKTILVKYMPAGKILAIGNNNASGYRVGEGATVDPELANALGYTHIAPTIEGGGRPGRWAQLYTPEATPMKLGGRAVTNGLPVIEAPDKIAVAESELD